MVAASIFMVVTLTTTQSSLTISEGLDFVRRLLVTFLIGLAVATGVSLFIMPITSRRNTFKALNDFAITVNELMNAQTEFVREHLGVQNQTADEKPSQLPLPTQSGADKIASTLDTLRSLLSKVNAELVYIKIEPAWGKLLPEDFIHIRDHISLVFLPLAGLSMMPEIFQSLSEDWSKKDPSTIQDHVTTSEGISTVKVPSWNLMTMSFEKRLASTCELTMMGLRTAFDLLEVSDSGPIGVKKNPMHTDIDKQAFGAMTRSDSVSEIFRKKLAAYNDRRRNLYKIWPSLISSTAPNGESIQPFEVRERLLVHLAMEHLQDEVLEAVHGLLKLAERKVNTDSMHRNRLIFPTHQIFSLEHLSWLLPVHSPDSSVTSYGLARPGSKMDAEHLPPTDWFERSSHHLRNIPRLLISSYSVFGARVALATLTVALLAFIRQTHEFFTKERIIWAMIVIVIGMKAESGASTFGYFARIAGTTVSLVLSLIVWYIVDARTHGVLVFLYLANVLEVRILSKFTDADIDLLSL